MFPVFVAPVFDERDIREGLGNDGDHGVMIPLPQSFSLLDHLIWHVAHKFRHKPLSCVCTVTCFLKAPERNPNIN